MTLSERMGGSDMAHLSVLRALFWKAEQWWCRRFHARFSHAVGAENWWHCDNCTVNYRVR